MSTDATRRASEGAAVSAADVIDRIVARNRALWIVLDSSRPESERRAALELMLADDPTEPTHTQEHTP